MAASATAADTSPLPEQKDAESAAARGRVCVTCAHDLLLCQCTRHDTGMNVAFMSSFALPEDAPVRRHLQRFVDEAEEHPWMSQNFPMRRFVNDFLAKGLLPVMRVRLFSLLDRQCCIADFANVAHMREHIVNVARCKLPPSGIMPCTP